MVDVTVFSSSCSFTSSIVPFGDLRGFPVFVCFCPSPCGVSG